MNCFGEKLMLSTCFSKYYCSQLAPIVTIFIDDGTVWPVKWYTYEERIWLGDGWEDVASHCGFKYEDILFFKLRSKSEMEPSVVRRSAHRITVTERNLPVGININEDENQELEAVNEEEVLWTTKLTNSSRTPGRPLYIPAAIMKRKFADRPAKIKVLMPEGEIKDWSFIWSGRGNEGHFGVGWYDFMEHNDLSKVPEIQFTQRRGEDYLRLKIHV